MTDTKTFWLSFADANGFGGVVIVDLGKDEIGAERSIGFIHTSHPGSRSMPWVIAAIRKSIRLKINPGPDYSIAAQELPPNEIPEQFKNRLLAAADVELLNMRPQ
jgi:hypothetical protein